MTKNSVIKINYSQKDFFQSISKYIVPLFKNKAKQKPTRKKTKTKTNEKIKTKTKQKSVTMWKL